MSWWLIEPEAAKQLRRAYKREGASFSSRDHELFAQQFPDVRAGQGGRSIETDLTDPTDTRAGPPRGTTVAGDTMEIKVEGILTKSPDFFLWFFGIAQSSYRDIISALALAKTDKGIQKVVLKVDSPGGEVDGLFDVLAALEDFRASKAISTTASKAQSAAYAIASNGGKITATNPAASFGSIGVVVAYELDDTIVELTNTDSPDKRPDVSTEEGKAVVVKYLDAVNELFVDAIARGRGGDVSAKDVKKDYGRGASMLAGEARRLGMIDAIASGKGSLRMVSSDASAAGGAPTKRTTMTKEELRAQHPALYEAVFNEGKAQGGSDERKRVSDHLDAFEVSGDQKTAFDAIRAGDPMTHGLMLKHLAAGRNRKDVDDRQADSDTAGAKVAGTSGKPEAGAAEPDMGDLIMKRDLEARGKKPAA
jgi:ClpP class serine protease